MGTEVNEVPGFKTKSKRLSADPMLCVAPPNTRHVIQLRKAVASGLMAKSKSMVGNLNRFHDNPRGTALTAGSLYDLSLRDANIGA